MLKKLLLFGVGGLALLTVGAAGAYFTAQVQVPENMVRAGVVSVSAEPTSAALSIDALAPGVVATRTLTVVNDGELPTSVIVTSSKKAGITDFWEALTCRVTGNGSVLYDGQLATLRTTPFELAADSKGKLEFAIGLPATAGNDLAGDYVRFSACVDAEQAH